MADGLESAELLPVGTRLFRRYIIDGVIARGGYGITYEAHDERSNARLALKEYFPGALSIRAPGSTAISPKNKACGALFFLGSEMFYRQHLALTDARGSSNVVTVYNAFFENGTSYAVMERLEGVTLESYLRLRKRKLTPEEAMFIAASMADALLVVHSLNSLHYDINAKSIFLCTEGSVKLIDFGAAKAGLRARREVDDTEPWLDLGALGKTLYEAMSGQTLYGGQISPHANIPMPFYDLLLRMLHQDGARRFSSVFEYRHALACLEIGAACPAVSSEEAGTVLPPLKKAENKRAEPQPQIAEAPPQKKTILDRALDTIQEAVEFSPEQNTPEVEQKRKHLTRRVILVYAAIAVVTLIAALVIKSLVK
ncbi:MAG: protein kinase [Clostridiaceae bacterium]